jgi:hypothetical protein
MKRILLSSLVILVFSLLVFPTGATTVTGINPDKGVNTGVVFITDLSGTDFPADASARLVMTDQPNITGQYLTVVKVSLS